MTNGLNLKPTILGSEDLALPEGSTALPPSGTSSLTPTMTSDFLGMDIAEQRKVLSQKNADFGQMEIVEQNKVLNNLKEDTMRIATLFGKGEIPEGSPEFTTAQQIYLKVRPFIEIPAEVAGVTAGAIVGLPVAPPFGSVLGAGLGLGMVRNVFKSTEAMLGLEEPQGFLQEAQEAIADIEEGALLEGGGQVLGAVAKGAKGIIKSKIIDPLAKRSTLTEIGAKQRAKDVLAKELKGTEITQPQIDRNVKLAKDLQLKIRKEIDPQFKFTEGQLTDDASSIALERTLARRGGADLTQSQRQHVVETLRQYYNKKVLSTGTVEDFVQYTERMAGQLEASTKQGVDAVVSEVARLNQHLEPQVFGTSIHKVLSTGKAELRKKATFLYDKIPNISLKTANLNTAIKSYVRVEDGIIEPQSRKMISLINSKILKKAPGKPTVTINPATGQKTVTEPLITKDVGYQVLRKLHSRVGKGYRASSSGANPNLEDARQLFKIQSLLDDAMRQIGNQSPSAAKAYEKATRFYKEDFIPTYRQGTIADVLQRGARGEETKIAKANIAQAFDSLDGIDDLVRAAGPESSARMMRDYYSYSLINTAVDAEGKVSAKKALAWSLKNKGKLSKLGLADEFKTLASKQIKVDEFLKTKDVFNKSIAGRILEADVDSTISNAYRGSKNLPRTTRELMALAKGNKAAGQGMKKAFAEFLIKKSESSVPGFFQSIGGTSEADIEFLKSMSKMNKIFKEFSPSIKIMFQNEPKKLEAIMDMWRGFRILERTAKSPIGAGSPTAELIFRGNSLGRAAGVTVGGVAPGKFYVFKVIRDWIQSFGLKNVERYLTRAMFDPDYAAVMTQAAKTNVSSAGNPAIRRLMKNAALITSDAPRRIAGNRQEE